MRNQNQNLTFSLNQLLLVNLMKFFSIDHIIKGMKSCGISIWIKPDEEMVISFITLERKSDGIRILYKDSCKSLAEIKDSIPQKLPVYVSIDGKGVLHKLVESNSHNNLIDQILPNARSDDFVIQELSLKDDKKVISAARRSNIKAISNQINDLGFDVLKISLGPFSFVNIVTQFVERSIVIVPNYDLVAENGWLDHYVKNESINPDYDLIIDTNNIESQYIIPFTNSLLHFTNEDVLKNDFVNQNSQNKSFHFKRIFNLFGLSIIVLIFTSLLVNYLLFESFRSKNQDLSQQIENNREILNQIEELKMEIVKKEDLSRSDMHKENTFYAFYLDRIAKDIPINITLRKLCINPIQKQLANDQIMQFQKNKILVSGYTLSASFLDSWIRSLKKLSWIDEIIIKNYVDNNIETAQFDLEISLKHK